MLSLSLKNQRMNFRTEDPFHKGHGRLSTIPEDSAVIIQRPLYNPIYLNDAILHIPLMCHPLLVASLSIWLSYLISILSARPSLSFCL